MIVTISVITLTCRVSVWVWRFLWKKNICLFWHPNEKKYPQTVNPTLTLGHPNQQREESPTERILQPLPSKGAAPCPGGQSWAGRLSELSISKTSCCNSAKTSEDDFITAFASPLPPQHQPQHLVPSPAVTPAEGPGCHHQHSISSCLCSFRPRIWSWACIVIWISTNKSRKDLPHISARGKCPTSPPRPGE